MYISPVALFFVGVGVGVVGMFLTIVGLSVHEYNKTIKKKENNNE